MVVGMMVFVPAWFERSLCVRATSFSVPFKQPAETELERQPSRHDEPGQERQDQESAKGEHLRSELLRTGQYSTALERFVPDEINPSRKRKPSPRFFGARGAGSVY